jgi:hypothetical protein
MLVLRYNIPLEIIMKQLHITVVQGTCTNHCPNNTLWIIILKTSFSSSLGSVTNVTRLAVQGESGTNNYVTSYEVDHSVDGIVFTNIKNGLKPQVSNRDNTKAN